MREYTDPTYGCVVERYVLTHEREDGWRVLTLCAQGRHTFDTAADAQTMLDTIKVNNAPDRLASVYGPRFIETVRVEPWPCWPGHHDPVRTIAS